MNEEEIDTIKILKFVYQLRKPIIKSVLGCLVISLIIEVFVPKTYLSKTVIAPPIFQEAFPSVSGITQYSGGPLYEKFISFLGSIRFKSMFEEYQGLQNPKNKESFVEFKKSTFSIESLPSQAAHVISHVSSNGSGADKELNDYLEFGKNSFKEELIRISNRELEGKKIALLQQQKAKYNIALVRQKDAIAAFQEAYRIAKKLDLKRSVLYDYSGAGKIPTISLYSPVSWPDYFLYMLGYEALGTQVQVLGERKDLASYIPGYRDLEENLSQLTPLDPNDFSVQPYSIMQAISDPILVKKYLILVPGIALVVGLIFGVLWGLTERGTFKKLRVLVANE